MKKSILRIGILLVVVSLFVTGCFKKTSITAEDFNTKMSDKGYVVQDATDQFASYEYIKKVYIALEKDGKYQIEFYEMDSEENASSFFETNKEKFETRGSGTSTGTESSGSGYEKYTQTANGKYEVISRVENTAIYVDADDTYKDQIKEVLDEFKY